MPRPRAKSRILPFVPRLGKVPDDTIAAEAGVSRTAVVNFRQQLGIAAYEGHRTKQSAEGSFPPVVPRPPGRAPRVRAFAGRRSRLDPFLHLLGVATDATVAHLAGLTVENVRSYRVRRGIPAAASKRRGTPSELTGAEALPTSSPLRTHQAAYSVVVERPEGRETYAVVAGDIAEAALLALRCVGAQGTVRAVTSVAPLLAPASAA